MESNWFNLAPQMGSWRGCCITHFIPEFYNKTLNVTSNNLKLFFLYKGVFKIICISNIIVKLNIMLLNIYLLRPLFGKNKLKLKNDIHRLAQHGNAIMTQIAALPVLPIQYFLVRKSAFSPQFLLAR